MNRIIETVLSNNQTNNAVTVPAMTLANDLGRKATKQTKISMRRFF